MTNAASAINSFLPAQDACSSVSQSEDPVFILSSAQLQEIITKAIQPLKQEIARDRKEIAALRDQLSSLEKDRDVLSDNQLIQLRLIQDLKEKAKREPGKTELSRAEKIEKYLASRPDHKATFETLKGHLGVDNDLLGIAIKSLLPSGKYAIIKTPGDKRKRALVMLPR
ncbi:hypothetical protein MCON_3558 (plasmid) [Methanothrix soehngenii GP6]|jgi:polyhydroxyalkanoate synthesis regulator phasin|uniref:Uncharacterized protein n=1 Tax=Methanothrix soehngenii (strain ATCC 5969 / DSM 3671 / JCM 10134 / NBRC 103675 / OCM 69 / GP-6) TaxID=990316 RepID=F4C0X2_METSG|nr:hypothetical protein MCON_3558 [Methanothrix soehngenii GP6]